jgi:membrane-associated phospholipid phosphatase
VNTPEEIPFRWTMVAQSLTRPYQVTWPMVALVTLVPFYIFIGDMMRGRTVHIPAVALDRALPLQPAWALVYGTLYLFLIVLPVFVVRQEEQIRRTVFAYLSIWITSYVIFLAYPTMAPRPSDVIGKGFAVWGLRFLYDADPPYNCFPSLHVAHSFVSALTCYRVHRRVGIAAMICASIVGLSTLFTKQHYILDVIAGILLACFWVAYNVSGTKLTEVFFARHA